MPNIRITAHGHHFEIDGIASADDYNALKYAFDAWMASITPEHCQQAQIDALAARIAKNTSRLKDAIAPIPPV